MARTFCVLLSSIERRGKKTFLGRSGRSCTREIVDAFDRKLEERLCTQGFLTVSRRGFEGDGQQKQEEPCVFDFTVLILRDGNLRKTRKSHETHFDTLLVGTLLLLILQIFSAEQNREDLYR